MHSSLNEGQLQFQEVVSRYLRDTSPTAVVRQLMDTDTGFDSAQWQRLCEDIGLSATTIPEAYGGFGFGAVELGIVMQEMGRNLYCGPYFASIVMAGHALTVAGEESVKRRLLPEIAAGTRIATLVLDDVNEPTLVGASIQASNGRLSGSAPIVLDAHVADDLVVVAKTASGLSLFCCASNAAGVTVELLESIDATRKVTRISFDSTPAEEVGALTAAQLAALWDHMSVALAHEMIGGAQVLFDSTVEYTKMRYQFGRPIGSFQALKHRCADQLLDLELAKALTWGAAFSLASNQVDPSAASMAKAMAADVYMSTAKMAIQLRGGIGFTWEEDTHLWYKRAKGSEVFLGAPHLHRERALTMLETQS